MEINNEMKRLSDLVIKKEMTLDAAKQQSNAFIKEKNPWQFVNIHEVKKGDVVDLSAGGLHHSWEEDTKNYPLGNITYEVQQDEMDPTSSIRSFDQGKFKEDGTIREIHIDDYFKYIDIDDKRNTLAINKSNNGILFDTPYYSLTHLSLIEKTHMEAESSFHHLFVQEGEIDVIDLTGNRIEIGRGHSGFIPQGLKYVIDPKKQSEILLTFLC